MAELTQARLNALFNYDPETGALIWRDRPREDFPSERGWKVFNTQCAGKEACATAKLGPRTYKVVRIAGRLYLQHRLVWLMVTGIEPSKWIVHKNLDGTDNRFANLRDARPSQSHANRSYQGKTVSGLKGAFWRPDIGRWESRIGVNGKSLYLGMHDTAELAHSAYVSAAQKHYGDFARTS